MAVASLQMLALAWVFLGQSVQAILTTPLLDDRRVPLLGVGVGNLQHNLIESIIVEAVREGGVRLVDTAAASRNEHLVRAAIDHAGASGVQVVTKVWYTHLGFNRTILSVRKSIDNIGVPPIVLIHWPRCRDDIPWMHCEEEEASLPESVKAAGPAPGVDAWRDSWRALEQLYRDGAVAAIGISNFDIQEVHQLLEMAQVPPMIFQGNVWSLIFDPHLMNLLRERRIHFQAYNVMNGVLRNVAHGSKARSAHMDLQAIGKQVGGTVAQVVLRWLIQQNIGVIPQTSSFDHVKENGAVGNIGALDSGQLDRVRNAVATLLRSESSAEEPKPDGRRDVVFSNKLGEDVKLFWLSDANEEMHVGHVSAGSSLGQSTFPGHRFLARSGSGERLWQGTISSGISGQVIMVGAPAEL